MNTILYKYLLKGEQKFQILDITVHDYFDLDDEEEISLTSTPKHSHIEDYLDIELSRIMFIHLIIKINNEMAEFKQTIWNNGNNCLCERIETGKEDYRELILTSRIDENKIIDEIIRIYCTSDRLYPVHHSFIKTNKDKTQEDIKLLDLNYFYKMYNKKT